MQTKPLMSESESEKRVQAALLTPEQAAAQLHISKKTLAKLRLPSAVISARKKLYRQEDIDAFVRSRLQCGSDDQRHKPNNKRIEVGLPRVLSRRELMQI
jgi:hypothetical protein